MTDNIFDEARRLVSARTAAEYYGFQPNRANFIQCPFHTEKTASLKLYEHNWHCFGCNQGGSSIDFVAKLFDLSPLEAVRRINADFHLALPLDKPPSKAQLDAANRWREMQDTDRDYGEWQDKLRAMLNIVYQTGWNAFQKFSDFDQLTEAEVLAIQWLETIEDWIECLTSGDITKEIKVFRDRRAIQQLCGRILNSSQMKSGAA